MSVINSLINHNGTHCRKFDREKMFVDKDIYILQIEKHKINLCLGVVTTTLQNRYGETQ